MQTISLKSLAALMLLFVASIAPLQASDAKKSYLQTLHRQKTLISTVPQNGDLNPYAIYVAPVSAGKIQKGDVLVSNFNALSNLQGTGTTIVDFNPTTKKLTTFADLKNEACPGGVGLSTAMIMLQSGWVIVGSAPSTDGTTRTLGAGCLFVLDPNGKLAATWANKDINCPWGNIAAIDKGTSATLFISMSGFDVPSLDVHDPETGYPVTVKKATVLRLELAIQNKKPPLITSQTVVANGYGQRADKGVFLIGPTGLVLADDGTLYVSDALGNQIVSVADALTRTTSAGLGKTVTHDGLLRRPLAMTMAPNGNLLIANARNGQVVEVNPNTGQQLGALWVDNNQAQTPPGNGDLFGIVMKPDGSGFYYVEDDVNTLVEATR